MVSNSVRVVWDMSLETCHKAYSNRGTEEMITEQDYRIVLCGASAYDKKYYFNNKFDRLPENVKEELQILCVLFTEEVGGIFTVGFTPTGELLLDTTAEEGDLLYDEIGSGLMLKEDPHRQAGALQSP